MNKQNQKDQQQNTDWSKQQKSNEGMSGSNRKDQGGRQQNQEPVEERSPNAAGNRQQDSKSGENRDPEINMPSNEPEKTEKKIPNYE